MCYVFCVTSLPLACVKIVSYARFLISNPLQRILIMHYLATDLVIMSKKDLAILKWHMHLRHSRGDILA